MVNGSVQMSRPRGMRRRFGSFAACLAMVVLASCSSGGDRSGSGATAPEASTTAITTSSTDGAFVLDEWSIRPPKAALEAGKVEIVAINQGREVHELVLVRAADAASLPTKPDGSVDEDAIAEAKKVGEIADVPANQTRSTSLDLPRGSYVAFCNIVDSMGDGNGGMGDGNGGMGDGSGGMGNGGMGPGMTGSTPGGGMQHVHYALGMVTTFTVT